MRRVADFVIRWFFGILFGPFVEWLPVIAGVLLFVAGVVSAVWFLSAINALH